MRWLASPALVCCMAMVVALSLSVRDRMRQFGGGGGGGGVQPDGGLRLLLRGSNKDTKRCFRGIFAGQHNNECLRRGDCPLCCDVRVRSGEDECMHRILLAQSSSHQISKQNARRDHDHRRKNHYHYLSVE